MYAHPSGHPVDRRRVLVIDDEPDIREALEMFLSGEGYDVATAESGESAVEQAQGRPFDLAITDLRMPGMGGYETLVALKRIHPNLPVIVVTGYASDEATMRCSKEGAFRIVHKPIHLEDLLQIIKAALNEARA
ncbi:response regulator [Sorangium sp. So ce426]|uniref:response regulator n=1 Tax=Sorangium sp. So ce426 TaxID=3133312 RepID=UPI003F5BFCAB